MTTSRPKLIIPLKNKCNCGNEVLNHHFLCDTCYSKKMKSQYESIKGKGRFNKPKWMQ